MPIQWTDHEFAIKSPDLYKIMSVNGDQAIQSWRLSLFSFEWLDGGETVKPIKNLKPDDRNRYLAIKEAYENGDPVTRPVGGIGINNNLEFGDGRAVFLTLYDLGVRDFEIHVRTNQYEDLKCLL